MNLVHFASGFANALAKHGFTEDAAEIRAALKAQENPTPSHSHINFSANVLQACSKARANYMANIKVSDGADVPDAIHSLGGYLSKALDLRTS